MGYSNDLWCDKAIDLVSNNKRTADAVTHYCHLNVFLSTLCLVGTRPNVA